MAERTRDAGRGGADTTIRLYAQVLGVVLLLIGVLGLLLGDGLLLNILNINVTEDLVHILTGGILAYVGFGRVDAGAVRSVVLALGIVYLLVGILGFVVPMMFGLIPTGYTVFDNLLHLALGVLSLVIALSGRGATAARG
jgi:hypothetical protein